MFLFHAIPEVPDFLIFRRAIHALHGYGVVGHRCLGIGAKVFHGQLADLYLLYPCVNRVVSRLAVFLYLRLLPPESRHRHCHGNRLSIGVQTLQLGILRPEPLLLFVAQFGPLQLTRLPGIPFDLIVECACGQVRDILIRPLIELRPQADIGVAHTEDVATHG